jgi:hypothetical protein
MRKVLAALFALALPFALAIDVASCGPTCPTLQSCGSAETSAAGAAGTAGSSSVTCDQLTALRACLDSFCQPADKNPFCTCYTRGDDIGSDCTCTTFDSASYCQQAAANGVDAESLDCSAASSSVATLCVGVQ